MAATLPRVLALSDWVLHQQDHCRDDFTLVSPGKDEDTLAWLDQNGRGITAMWAVGLACRI